MTKQHKTRKHSDFAASAAYRWMACPGSVALSKKAPPQKESKYAIEGTRAHECLEALVKASGFKAEWNSEMRAHAVNAKQHILDLCPSPFADLLIEQRVSLKHIHNSMFGTLDYAWVDDCGDLVVIDYKYGAGYAVPVFEDGKPNPQLMYYALGLAHKYNYNFERVQLAIIQPRTAREGESPVTSGYVKVPQVKEFGRELKEAVKAAQAKEAPLVSGDHCRFCPALPICPQNSTKAMAEAEIVFDAKGEIEAMPEVLGLTPLHMPKLLDACDKLDTWIRSVRERAFALAESGEDIPGYKLVAKRGKRVWNAGAEKACGQAFGDRIYDKVFLSPAQFEKRFGVNGKEFTKELTTSISSGSTLVKDNDKRSELKELNPFDTI